VREFLITLAVAVFVVVAVFGALWKACDVPAGEPLPVRRLDLARYAPAAPVPVGRPTPPTEPALTRVAPPAVGWATATITLPAIVRGPRHGAPLPVLVGTGAYRPTAARRPAVVDDTRHLRRDWRTAPRDLAWSQL
jgi:hypothetical protein